MGRKSLNAQASLHIRLHTCSALQPYTTEGGICVPQPEQSIWKPSRWLTQAMNFCASD